MPTNFENIGEKNTRRTDHLDGNIYIYMKLNQQLITSQNRKQQAQMGSTKHLKNK